MTSQQDINELRKLMPPIDGRYWDLYKDSDFIFKLRNHLPALLSAWDKREHLASYVGSERFMSDFRTAGDMRDVLDYTRGQLAAANAEIERLKADSAELANVKIHITRWAKRDSEIAAERDSAIARAERLAKVLRKCPDYIDHSEQLNVNIMGEIKDALASEQQESGG